LAIQYSLDEPVANVLHSRFRSGLRAPISHVAADAPDAPAAERLREPRRPEP
jgi:hypothetical protein